MDAVNEAKRMLGLYFQFQHPELLEQVIDKQKATDLAEAIDRLIVARLAAMEPKRRGTMSTESGASAEMPRYRCHKEVWALKIKEIKRVPSGNATVTHSIVPEDARYAPFEVSLEYIGKHSPQAGGYYVVYKDGYISYSPADAFEDGYTLIS